MSDHYAVPAEYYDLWASSYWKEAAPALRAALACVDPSLGPMVEAGAGTGLGTVIIADQVPHVRIVAVEPSRAMRAALVSRLVARPDLVERVTVLPVDLARVRWPEQLAGFVAMGMLGHLDPHERVQLWRELGSRLAPGAPALVHLLPPDGPERVPLTRVATGRLGEREYEAWSEAEPDGDRRLRWTMTYRVLRGREVVDEQRCTFSFHTIREADVRDEAGDAGLVVASSTAGLVVLRRARDRSLA